jgi:ribonuclease HI
MMIYKLWLARNEARESKQIEDPRAIAEKARAAVEEWASLQMKTPTSNIRSTEHWLCPELGWVKVNVDGAFRTADSSGGSGVVLRDHHGVFICGASHFFSHVADAEGAELLACRRGVLLARESQVQKLVLETDSTGVAAKLVKVDLDRSFHGPLVEEIKFLLRGFGDHAVRAVRRSANEAAHVLAKLGCETKACNVWFGDAPASIVNQLVLDSSF